VDSIGERLYQDHSSLLSDGISHSLSCRTHYVPRRPSRHSPRHPSRHCPRRRPVYILHRPTRIPPAVRVVALPAARGVTPAAFSGMASLALVLPSQALPGWTTAVGKKTVEPMTIGSATVGPRTIVSAIGGWTDDGLFTSMGAVCDKSVTFSQFPLSGLHSRRRSRDLSMVPVEIVDRDPPSYIARDIIYISTILSSAKWGIC